MVLIRQNCWKSSPSEAWVVSDKLEPVSGFWKHCALAGKKLPPLRKCGGAVLLEILSVVEMTFLVEVIVDRAVDVCELLQTSHLAEALHCSFSSS